jgi:hypothetical protein
MRAKELASAIKSLELMAFDIDLDEVDTFERLAQGIQRNNRGSFSRVNIPITIFYARESRLRDAPEEKGDLELNLIEVLIRDPLFEARDLGGDPHSGCKNIEHRAEGFECKHVALLSDQPSQEIGIYPEVSPDIDDGRARGDTLPKETKLTPLVQP